MYLPARTATIITLGVFFFERIYFKPLQTLPGSFKGEDSMLTRIGQGAIALSVVTRMVSDGTLPVSKITSILLRRNLYAPDVHGFAARMRGENHFWERRSQELALEVLIALTQEAVRNLLTIFAFTHHVEFFHQTIVLAHRHKHARATFLEL